MESVSKARYDAYVAESERAIAEAEANGDTARADNTRRELEHYKATHMGISDIALKSPYLTKSSPYLRSESVVSSKKSTEEKTSPIKKIFYTDDEITRGGSDFFGGKDSFKKGRAKAPDGSKLFSSKDGIHYADETTMKLADEVYEGAPRQEMNGSWSACGKNFTGADAKEKSEEYYNSKKSELDKIKGITAKEEVSKPTTKEEWVGWIDKDTAKINISSKAPKGAEIVFRGTESNAVKWRKEQNSKKTDTAKLESEGKIKDEPKTEPKETTTTDDKTAEITTREVKDNLQRNQFAQYRNSLHPSTVGAILSKNSGLSAGERVSMALKAIGKLTGNAFLANGMSLLGDNSYFSKIGEGLDLDSMTSDEQKKVSDELANQIASEAVDVQANKTVIERELAEMPQAKKDYLSASAHALISLSPENFKAQLKGIKIKDPKTKAVITFTDDEINNIIKIKPMLQNNSKTTRANQSDIVDTKAKQRDFNFENFKKAADKTKAIQDLEEIKNNLIQSKSNITQSNGIDKQIDAFQKYASAYGGIGSSSYTSSQSQNSAKQSSSQWNVSGSVGVKIPIADIGVTGGGGHSWGENTAFGTNDGKSFTFNENYKFGGEKGKKAFEKWWSDYGSSIQDELLNSIDERIKDLDNDIAEIRAMSVVDDALIPNGEIESIQLKDGSTVVPNENDGAVLTTNPVSDSFLTFGEGEENPFDYLGYEGKKLTQEEAERIFDKEPLSDYESIMAYLDS